MSTCERGRKATAPSRSTVKPPLTWLKMMPSTRSLLLYISSSLTQLSSRRAFSRLSTASPSGVLDAVDIDLDDRAHLDGAVTAGLAEFLERDAAFGLETDVDDREILFDRDDGALDDGAFQRLVLDERVHQQGFKIFLRHSLHVPNYLSSAPGGLGVNGPSAIAMQRTIRCASARASRC